MIQVVLLILKIIGIVLLALFLLVLLVVGLVLFAPVRYRIKAEHNPEKTLLTGRASFLSPLVVVKFRYFEEVFSYRGRAAWYVFLDSGKNKEVEPEENIQDMAAEKEQQPATENTKPEAEANPEVFLEAFPEEDAETKEILKKMTKASKPEDFEEKKVSGKDKKKEKKEKTGKKTGILEKIKRIFRQKYELKRILAKPESKAAVALALGGVKKTLRHILPGKVKGYLLFGTGDPASTGQILGLISVFYAAAGPIFRIVPDFEEKRLECDLELRGRLRVFTLLVILLKLYFNKELKQLMQELKALKDIE